MKHQHLSTDSHPKNDDDKFDKRLQDSFPTSDPPSHSPGTVGAPDSDNKANHSPRTKKRREA